MRPTDPRKIDLAKAGFYRMDSIVGAGVLDAEQVSVFDAYDRLFFQQSAGLNLAGQTLKFFSVGLGGNYNPLNAPATSITKDEADTNWDLQGQSAYAFIFQGIAFNIGTSQMIDGTAGAVDDLAFAPNTFNELLQEASYELIINDYSYDRGKLHHAPSGGGSWQANSQTGTAAAPVNRWMFANGLPVANNYKSYSEMPLWMPQNERLKVNVKFGKNALAANSRFAPVAPSLYIEARMIGLRIALL